MDTKRLILAVALSIVVIMIYQQFFMPKPKPVPRPQPGEGQEQTQPAQPDQTQRQTEDKTTAPDKMPDIFAKKKQKEVVEDAPKMEVEENLVDISVKEIVVETDLFRAVFTNKGAGLKSFVFKKYNDDEKNPMDLISEKVNKKFGDHEIYPFYLSPFEDLDILREINSKSFLYKGSQKIDLADSMESSRELLFEYADVEKKVKVTKRFTVTRDSYVVHVDYDVVIDGIKVDVPIIFGPDLENNVSKSRVMQSTLRIGAYDGDDVREKIFAGIKTDTDDDPEALVGEADGIVGNGFYWAAYDTNYFAAIFKTHKKHRQIKYKLVKLKTGPKKFDLYSYIIVTKPEAVFLGPKDERILAKLEEEHGYLDANKAVDYGWSFFGAIAKLLLKGILFFHGFIPNIGWALVVFTIFIKILLFPLTYASSVSMAKMQTLQPKLKAIKKKYKNVKDPEQRKQMNMETMALYKSEKVNPAGGCLPLLLQMPILFAFFRLLPISIAFRHEPWMLWISDLSIKDPIYALPILMGVTQIMVSKMSPTTGDSAQKKIMYIMPVVMVFLFMNYSAGLNLYWFISNLLQMVQQHFINKKIFKEKKQEDRQLRASKRKKGGKGK
jgi:YidC/Oxa1 family membrane protein insertase